MNDLIAVTFSGRCFSSDELALMRQATTDYAVLGITEISRTICEWLDWKRPNGRLKNHECRQLLERLQLQGVLSLPDLRLSGRPGPRPVATDTRSDSQTPIRCSISDLEPLRLTLIENSDSALWRQFIQRYHYLGCRVPVGAHLRYFVYSAQGQILACLLWTSPAWKMAARDQWIGWTAHQRALRLQYIVNNSRFLILPWVQVKGLASTILSRSARQVLHDWRQHYSYTPLLLETLVDVTRFKGTCYRAANWLHVGQTSGRGRMDREHQRHGEAIKDIYVYPLVRDARQRLSGDPTQQGA